MKTTTLFIMVLFFVLITSVSATWCDTDYAKRVNVNVNNTAGGALTDYQVYVNLSANPINETSLRVYNSSDCTLRPHWCENITNGNCTKLWINYSSIAASAWTNNTAIYYEYAVASSTSDGDNTFEFFDDFESSGYTSVLWANISTDVYTNGFYSPQTPYGIYNASQNKTYIVWQTNDCGRHIIEYDHLTDTFQNETDIGGSKLSSDGHGAPALGIDNNGYFYVFYGSHGSAQYYKKSTNVHDITSWGSEQTAVSGGATYPQAFYTDNKLWLFYRNTNKEWSYKTTSDGGSSWSAETEITDFSGLTNFWGVYAQTRKASNGDIHITWMWRDNSSPINYYNIYYVYYNISTSQWEKRDGTVLTLPINETSADKVFTGDDTWIWGLDTDSNNEPYILFAYSGDNKIKLAKWKNSAWAIYNMTSYTFSPSNDYGTLKVDTPTNMRVLMDATDHKTAKLYNSTDGGENWMFNKTVGEELSGKAYNVGWYQVVADGNGELEFLFGPGVWPGSGGIAAAWGKDSDFTHNEYTNYDLSNKWDTNKNPAVSNGILTCAGELEEAAYTKNTFLYKAFKTKARLTHGGTDYAANAGLGESLIGSDYDAERYWVKTPTETRAYSGNSTNQEFTAITSCNAAWHLWEVLWENGEAKFYVDNNLEATHSTCICEKAIPVMFQNYRADAIVEVDWVFVRKYSSPEPSTTLGNEEQQSATTPVISNVQNGSIFPTSQWIDWDVNQTAHNRVKYSNESDLTPTYYSTWDNSTNVPNITLNGLEASTQYWYQVWSHNTSNTSLSDNSSTMSFTTVSDANPTLHIGNVINTKEDWGRDFNSNLSANVTAANASGVWMNFSDVEFTNTSLGWVNLTLNEWVNKSHNVNIPVTNVSVDVTLNSTTSGATNDTESFWYEVTKRTNTATMDSNATQSVGVSISFYVNGTCKEEYGYTFLGAANLLEDGAIVATNSSVTNYVNFDHSESSAGVYNYTIRFYNLTHYDNITTPTYSNVTVAVGDYIPPDATTLVNSTGNFWVNHTWNNGTGNITNSYNVSVNVTWYNCTTNLYYNNTPLTAHKWSNITVWAYNTSGSGTLSAGSISQNTQIPNNVPVLSGLPDNTTDEDVNQTDIFDLDMYFSDVDGDTPTYLVESNNQSANVDVTINASNNVSYTLASGWNGTASVVINVTDGWSGEDNDTFLIIVNAAPLPGDYIPGDPTGLGNTTGNYWVNYTWSVGGGNATDSYNVSWNSTWYNGTTNTFMKKEVGASNWANITLYAYNASGNGSLSTGYLTDNVQAPAYMPGDYPPATPTSLANTTGNGWVNYTWASGGGANITDSYNVSWNLTWHNNTLVTYMNDTVGEFGWANISVWAFNSSGNGSLSAGSISDETQAGGGTFTTSMGTTAYNLITYYGSTTSTAEQFGLDIGSVDYIAMYNGSFYTHTMGYVSNNFTVYHGIGYYVYLNASGSSTYQRSNISDVPYNIQLFNRWNTIGWTNSTNTNAEGVASSIGSACKYTSTLNVDGITYTTHTVGFASNNHVVEKGKGYWTWVNTGVNWGRNS